MVTGIAAAKWLASLAPPREAAWIGRPSAAEASASTGATACSECMPGQRRISSGLSVTPPTSRGMASQTASIASSSSARQSQNSSPAPGTTLKASPERRMVGTEERRAGP